MTDGAVGAKEDDEATKMATARDHNRDRDARETGKMLSLESLEAHLVTPSGRVTRVLTHRSGMLITAAGDAGASPNNGPSHLAAPARRVNIVDYA